MAENICNPAMVGALEWIYNMCLIGIRSCYVCELNKLTINIKYNTLNRQSKIQIEDIIKIKVVQKN